MEANVQHEERLDLETDLRDVPGLVDGLLPAGSEQQTYQQIIRMTRRLVQYGISGFAVLFIIVGAVEALFGR